MELVKRISELKEVLLELIQNEEQRKKTTLNIKVKRALGTQRITSTYS